MTTDTLYFARCKSGKKWFWATFTFESPKPIEHGYESTLEGAEAHKPGGVHQAPAGWAHSCLRCLSAMKKAEKHDEGSGQACPNEYLYTDWYSDYDCMPGSSRHLVVKKTNKKVFVEIRHWSHADEDWQRYYGRGCVALDRAELEREGSVWSGRRRQTYYTTPWEERHQRSDPGCLKALGLRSGATKQEIKAAYRRHAKLAHPDTGGSHVEFVALHRAYEQSIALAAG